MFRYLLILFIFPSICFSETSLWQVSKNGNHLYLGGTIHMLKKEDYPLPIEFNAAFKNSDKLVFETDIDKAQGQEFAEKMAKMFTYPSGKTLKQAISKKTFKTLEKHLADRKIPIDIFLQFKPSMIVIVLTVIELKKMGMVDIGVDQFFHKKAKESGKSIGYLETVDEQLSFLLSMGKGNENDMIINTINDMTKMEHTMALIKAAWLSGNEAKMVKVALSDMVRDYPDLHKTLLVKRNNNWMPQVEKMMSDKSVEMVLVGALHLVGKDGLLQQLRNKGYSVKQFRN